MRRENHHRTRPGTVPSILCLLLMSAAGVRSDELPPAATEGGHELRLEPVFTRYTGEPVRPNRTQKKWIFQFKLLGGSAFAAGNMNSFVIDWATTEGSFTVDADRWTRRAAQLAQPLTRQFKRHGYTITPEDARIAVIYPSAHHAGRGDPMQGWSYFKSAASGRSLAVVYVDRPCLIEGTERDSSGSPVVTYRARLDVPGFHMVALARDDAGKASVAPVDWEKDLKLITELRD